MSEYEKSHEDIPRFEPWLGVMAAAFVPAVGTLYLPSHYLPPLIVVTVALFIAGLAMLRRQTNQKRSADS